MMKTNKSSRKATKATTTKKAGRKQIKHPGARVWRLPVESVREPLKAYRETEGISVRELYKRAIERAVAVAAELVRMGLSQGSEVCGPVRVMHTDEELALLREAAAETGLDQRQLLLMGLRGMLNDRPPARRRRRG